MTLVAVALLLAVPAAGSSAAPVAHPSVRPRTSEFTYLDAVALRKVKTHVQHGACGRFGTSYRALLADAEAALARPLDPVTAKTQTPPSGDKHDYLSLAPYWWPDPDSSDGLPWIRRDGEVNPLTRGPNTDQLRWSGLLHDLDTLSVAYHLSDDPRYATKMEYLLTGWFLDPATRMNPSADFGQGVPGSVTGRPAGLIEFEGLSSVVSASEVLRAHGVLAESKQAALDTWLGDFAIWMLTSEIGQETQTKTNNIGNWYDYVSIGLLIHVGRTDDARAEAEAIKTRRIAVQIEPDGRQPLELERTKSINYATMSLRALVYNGLLAEKVGVDILGYRTADGRSIIGAYKFLVPYANGKPGWPYQQITEGGVETAIHETLQPGIVQAEMLLSRKWLKPEIRNQARSQLSPLDRLKLAIPG